MKTEKRMTNISLRGIVALITLGLAIETMAATPVAVWDGDFTDARKGAWTLSSTGSTITDAKITIGTTPITMTPDSTQNGGWYTVVYKVKGLTYTSQTPLATWGRPNVSGWNNADLIGVFLDYDYPWGVWNGAERAQYSMQKKVGLSQAGAEERRIVARFHSGADYGTWAYVDGTQVFTADEKLKATMEVNRMTILGFQYNSSSVLKGAEVTCIAIFSESSNAGDAAYTSYKFPSESGAYETSVGSGTKAWSALTWRKGTGTSVSTADLPEGSALHVTVYSGATLTITAADAAQLAAKKIGLKATQFTNNGTVKFSGGTAEAPIAYEADGAQNHNLGTMTLAKDTYLKVTPNGNNIYKVTGEDRATSALEIAYDHATKGIGLAEGTQIRNLKLVANVTSTGQDGGFWVERANAVDATVDLVAAGQITVYECNPTLGSLSGSGSVIRPYGSTCTLTLTPTADAEYAGHTDQNFVIAGTAVQTLSGGFTGTLTVNSGATVAFDGAAFAPSSITGPGTIRKVGDGATTIAGAKVSKATKPAAIEVSGGTLNFSAGQFFSEDKENVALPLTVTGGTLNLNGAWTYTGGDASGWLYSKPITIGGTSQSAIVGGSVTPYKSGDFEMLHYVGGEDASNAPATFGAAIYSTYQKDNRVRQVNVEKGMGSAEGGFDLEMTGVLGAHNDSSYLKAFLFTKTGAGVLRVSNTNNFPNTTVAAGTYQLGCPEALPAGLSVASTATLDLGGLSLTNRSLTCGGTIANGTLVSSGVTVDLTGATIGEGLSLVVDLADAIAGLKPFAGVDYAKVTVKGESQYLTYNTTTGTFTLRDDCKLGDTLTWLPIGDSITEGEQYMGHPDQGDVNSRGGYRYQLWNEFEQAGQTTRSVGYRTGHKGTEEDPATCRWAWHAAQYGGVIMHDNNGSHGAAGMNVENTLEVAGYPDIVTVLIGVNDLSFVSLAAAYEWVFGTWRNMVAKYADQRPHSKIVVSTLLPATGDRPYIAAFNKFVRDAHVAGAMPFDRPNVVFADIALLAFNNEAKAQYFWDGLHPNETGAKIVAAAWMKALQPVMAELAQSSAVPVQIHNATAGKVSVRYSKAIKSIETATLTISGTNVNGKVENWTFTGPTIKSGDARIVEFDTGAAVLIGGDYTATLTDVDGTDGNDLPIPSSYASTSDLHLSIYGTGAAANVPAAFRKGFERLQTINVTECDYGGNGPNVPCERLLKAAPVTHVGYYVELQRANEAPQFVWVSMDATPFGFTTNNVGIPTVKGGVIRSKVTELQVFGNHGNFTNTAIGDTTQTGVIEFSPWTAAGTDQSDFPKEFKSDKFGWNDTLTDTSTLKGCMQVARETHAKDPDDYTRPAGEMIFAFNTFNGSALTDLGIGTFSTHRTNAGGNFTITPVYDWTDFAQTTGYTPFMLSAYQVKKIEIWVKVPKTSLMLFVK